MVGGFWSVNGIAALTERPREEAAFAPFEDAAISSAIGPLKAWRSTLVFAEQVLNS